MKKNLLRLKKGIKTNSKGLGNIGISAMIINNFSFLFFLLLLIISINFLNFIILMYCITDDIITKL